MIVVRFKVQCQPEKTASVKAALAAVIAPSRATEGVISFDIVQDLGDPNAFIATECSPISGPASGRNRFPKWRP